MVQAPAAPMHHARASLLVVAAIAALGPFGTAIAKAADPTLVSSGKSSYEIVVDAAATSTAQLAAMELQTFVEQATGVKLPIVAKPGDGKPHLFVGPNPVSAKAGVVPDDLKPEGFHLKRVGADLHFVGRDTPEDPKKIWYGIGTETGTLTAVYEFVERVLGVVFAWDDDLGVVVPRHDTVTIPAVDVTQHPAWGYRVLAYGPRDATHELLGRRLRLGHAYGTDHQHQWYAILPVAKYAAEHPEYFALVDGKRRTAHYGDDGHHGGQVCTSNPEVVEIFARAAIEHFKHKPRNTMFPISPNDGEGFCECAACRALDGGEFLDAAKKKPVLTDRLLTFYNAIAERVAKECPDKFLGAYAYSFYQRPPVRVKEIHPMLYLVQATNSGFGQGQGWAEEHAGEKKWVALTKTFDKYDIYYLGPPALCLMAPVTTHLIEKLRAEQACGLNGGYLYIGQTYEQLGAGHALMARLMWDGSADARGLEKKYYEALYGPAAADVKAYYDLLEGRLRKVLVDHETVDEPAVANLRTRYENSLSAGELIGAYWPVLDRAEAIMAAAKGRTLSDLEKQRLARLEDQHDLLVSTVRGMVAACRLEIQAVYKESDVAMYKAACSQREAVKERLASSAPTLLPGLKEIDKGDTARLLPDGGFFRTVASGKPPRLAAPAVAAPPKLDGKGDDAVWQQVPATYFVAANDASPTPLGARAKLAHDDKHLYVFVEGREPGKDGPRKTVFKHDDVKVFDDDAVEIFLTPPGGERYHQIAVGAGGGVYDAAYRVGGDAAGDVSWESRAKARVAINATGWSAEIAVPFAALGAKPGEGWRANVCRTRRGNATPAENTALIPTFDGYHRPHRFAEVLFAPPPAVNVAEGTFDDIVAIGTAKNLRIQLEGGATAKLVGDRVWCGSQGLHVVVPAGGLAGVTFPAAVKPGVTYRLVVGHFNSGVTLTPGVQPKAPLTRIIYQDEAGKNVTESSGYAWDGSDATAKQDQWRQTPHIFTTPDKTARVSITVFLVHEGEYWLDEIRLDEM